MNIQRGDTVRVTVYGKPFEAVYVGPSDNDTHVVSVRTGENNYPFAVVVREGEFERIES